MAKVGLLTILAFVASSSTPTWATPITVLPDSVANVRDHRGANDVGAGVGDFNAFGAAIVPAENAKTSNITAVQAGFTVGPRVCAPTSAAPDGCFTAIPLDLARLGSWLLTFTNGVDVVSVPTPTLSGTSAVPLATNVSLTGGGFTPTFRFDVPEGFVPNAIRIQIFDKSVTLPGPTGGKDIIHSAPMPSGARSYTVPPVLSSGQTLQVGKPYVLAITLIELRPPFTEADFVATNRLAMVLSRSLTFFDFTPSPPPTVMVTSNATIFRPGELLEIDVTVANPGESAAVDVYFGVMLPSDAGPGLGCPGGDAVAFITGASAQVTCLSAPAETFQPFASNVTLPAALPSTTLSDFFKYTWGTTELAGTYTFFLALTPVAAFADGQVDPSDLLAIGAQTVTFDPEP